MKRTTSTHRNRRERGSILVICMVLAGLGTIGAAAFFSLIQAKSEETNERQTAMTRRIRLANSRALAKEALFRNHLGSPTAPTGGAQTYTLAGEWGKAIIGAHPAAPLAASAATRLHKTGAMPYQAFTEDIAVTISDGNSDLAYQGQAKSSNPALGGDLLVVQTPTGTGAGGTTFSGNLIVQGRAVFREGNYAAPAVTDSSIQAKRVLLSRSTTTGFTIKGPDGSAILPDNSILPPTTSGVVGAEAAFDGRVNVIGNPDTAINDYADYVSANGGARFAGNSAQVTTDGPPVRPPGLDDPTLLSMIAGMSSPFPASLPTTLRPYIPLSSQVFSALIAKSRLADEAVMTTIFSENTPLASDIMRQVVDGTAPLTEDRRWYLVRNNPVGLANNGRGTLYLDLDASTTGDLLVTNYIQTLILRGQEDTTSYTSAASLFPLVVTLVDDGSVPGAPLTSVSLEGSNNRPLILAAKKQGNYGTAVMTFTSPSAFPQWRGLLELEGLALNVDTSSVSAATLVGGIRTDRSIRVSSGTLTLDRDPNVASLQVVASRNAWVELVNLP